MEPESDRWDEGTGQGAMGHCEAKGKAQCAGQGGAGEN